MFDEMVLGIQNYYRIATCISLDCRRVHRKIMTVLTNRLKTESGGQLIREGGVMTESEKERYGKSKMIRYVSGINRPIYPIAFVKYKPAIGISSAVCCYSPSGRKKIHENLELNMALFTALRKTLPDGHSMEYADCRYASHYSGKYYSPLYSMYSLSFVHGLKPDDVVCYMKVPKELGGYEQYKNLLLFHRRYLPLLVSKDEQLLKKNCKSLAVTKKQLTKINDLRAAAKLAAI